MNPRTRNEETTLIMSIPDYARKRGLSLAMTRKIANLAKANFYCGKRHGVISTLMDEYILENMTQ